VAPEQLSALQTPLAVTSSHRGRYLHEMIGSELLSGETCSENSPTGRLAELSWIFGHEGQGVSAQLNALAQSHVRIAQPGGQESLNVAAAAAICLHTSAIDRMLASA